jgi:hypothetical protein
MQVLQNKKLAKKDGLEQKGIPMSGTEMLLKVKKKGALADS